MGIEAVNYVESNDIYGNVQEIIKKAFDALYFQIMIDKQGKIVYINDHYANFLGVQKHEIIGKQIEDVIPNTQLYSVITTGEATIDEVFEFEDGRQIVHSKLPIKNSYGEIQGVVTASSLNTIDQIENLKRQVDSLQESNSLLIKQIYGLDQAPEVFDAIVGHSPKIIEIKNTLSRICNSSMPILLTGESGTGKEVFATAIHNASNRKEQPFIKVNCAAIPKELVESELFGYETGTFSGAVKGGKAGKFELANHGTILLDEIEELPLEAQSKLLRVLQEYEVERIGSVKPIALDIHIVCCSNKNLYEMVEEKKFREDLLYRINVMEIEIPPLRERMDDIEPLCKSIITSINKKYKLKIRGISKSTVKFLSTYTWPGNVRELSHTLERACVLSDNKTLSIVDFGFLEDKINKSKSSVVRNELSSDSETTSSNSSHQPFFLGKDLYEREAIITALNEHAGNKTKAAKALGISRSLLYSKINKYNL